MVLLTLQWTNSLSQEFLEISRVYFQQEIDFSSTCRFLFQQSSIVSQVHEITREFFMWYYPLAKMLTLQMLHPPHYLVWLPVMVLSSCLSILTTQGPWKNAKKDSHLDIRSIQDISIWRNRGNCRSHSYQAIPSETRGQITALSNVSSHESYHLISHRFLIQLSLQSTSFFSELFHRSTKSKYQRSSCWL